jgi:mannitol-specific phosphotransferase system IIBC component
MLTAIERLKEPGKKIFVNNSIVHGIYISGASTSFFNSEREAMLHINKAINGVYFTLPLGKIFYVEGDKEVYLSEDRSPSIDKLGEVSQMPFVQWMERN